MRALAQHLQGPALGANNRKGLGEMLALSLWVTLTVYPPGHIRDSHLCLHTRIPPNSRTLTISIPPISWMTTASSRTMPSFPLPQVWAKREGS